MNLFYQFNYQNVFLILKFITTVLSVCLSTNFHQSTLSNTNFYQEKNYIRVNPYALGVWIQYTPLRNNSHSNPLRPQFYQNETKSGFHILNFESDGKVKRYFANNIKTSVRQNNVQFEEVWIFTYFCFKYDDQYNLIQQNTADFTYQNIFLTKKLLPQTSNVRLQYGRGGVFKIESLSYNLNMYLGRNSIITTFEDSPQFFTVGESSKFQSFLNYCYIPSKCQQQKNIELILQPAKFLNSSILIYTLREGYIFSFYQWNCAF